LHISGMNLLCISNGHGEDIIAVRVLKELRCFPDAPSISALPIVGEGGAYQKAGIPIVGPTQTMPSGGFISMDARQVFRDLQGGLVGLTWEQIKTVRAWGKTGGKILAVGDLVPLLMAWASGAEYAFIGTAKSEYYVRNEAGRLSNRSWLEGRWSIYLPWERWLMRRRHCRGVFVRDQLTADSLQRCRVKASYPGNPMMDGLDADTDKLTRIIAAFPPAEAVLTLALIPGSRAPEAFDNWQRLLLALDSVAQVFPDRQVRLLGAIAPALNLAVLKDALIDAQWQPETGSLVTFFSHNCCLVITTDAFAECLHLADAALATAGTATEQAVGLGKPVFTVPGAGPQFTDAFAEAQARLLGLSVTVVKDPTTLGQALAHCLQDRDRLQHIAENGRTRLGQAGAGRAIATALIHGFSPERPAAPMGAI
jgi:uncharacterized protein (TIGR03492 family)